MYISQLIPLEIKKIKEQTWNRFTSFRTIYHSQVSFSKGSEITYIVKRDLLPWEYNMNCLQVLENKLASKIFGTSIICADCQVFLGHRNQSKVKKKR